LRVRVLESAEVEGPLHDVLLSGDLDGARVVEALAGFTVELEELNWLGSPLVEGDSCEIQIRYRSPAIPATVVGRSDDRLTLALDTAGRAITPGQSGVLYRGDQMLGGGVIAASVSTRRSLPIMQSA
jgi:tRNA U34 2-thiouridine synthase MnmA/TrmU